MRVRVRFATRSVAEVVRWMTAVWIVGAIRSAGAQSAGPSPSAFNRPREVDVAPFTTRSAGPSPAKVITAPMPAACANFNDTNELDDLLGNDILEAAPSNISLFGATGQPQPSDVVGHFFYGNSFFNGMLAALARRNPDALKTSIRQSSEQPACQYIVTLSHQGKRVEVPVDNQFIRSSIGSINDGFEGNACGFHLGIDALWPALFEKAFGILSSDFLETYYPDNIFNGFRGHPRFDHRVINLVTPQLAVRVASIAPIQTYRLGQRDDYARFLDHRGAIQVGLLTFLAGSSWPDSAAASGYFRNDLDFSNGDYCFLYTVNRLYVADCTLAGGANVTVQDQGAYILEPGVASSSSLQVRHNQVAFSENNIQGGGSHFEVYNTPVFSVPLSLARELNATIFASEPISPVTAKAPLFAPAASPARNAEQPAMDTATAPPQTSGACGMGPHWFLPCLMVFGCAIK